MKIAVNDLNIPAVYFKIGNLHLSPQDIYITILRTQCNSLNKQ
jgi:hypothetical protein